MMNNIADNEIELIYKVKIKKQFGIIKFVASIFCVSLYGHLCLMRPVKHKTERTTADIHIKIPRAIVRKQFRWGF